MKSSYRYNPDFAEVQTSEVADYRILAKLHPELTDNEQQAIGHLFAAAPGLLRHLDAIVTLHDTASDDEWQHQISYLIADARATLKALNNEVQP